MKILLVHNAYQQGGGEDVVFEQERRMLEAAGHNVVVYRRSNWEVEKYSRLALARRTVWAEDAKDDVARLLRREKPDVVHVHNTFVIISPSIYWACVEAHVPVVLTLHNYRLFCPAATFFRDGHVCEECLEHGLWRAVEHGCYRYSRPASAVVAWMLRTHRRLGTWERGINCFIALTEFARRKFIQAGLPAEKIFVKPNFVHPDPATGHPKCDYALFVGRLSPEKRVNTLLAAWKKLSNRIPLRIVGGGPERAELETDAVQNDLSAVEFLGKLPRQQTLEAINGARLLVFCSEWYENFPVTIAEAFACSTPVISSRLGAMQEIVEEGRTGLHFTVGDPDDLADKVKWAWDHPAQMQGIAQAARREYESKYTADKNYPLLIEVYRRVMTEYAQS